MFPSILEIGETQEREKETVCTTIKVQMGNVGMCLNQELDLQPFGSLDTTPQPTEPPGQGVSCL